MVTDPLARRFTEVDHGVGTAARAHVRTSFPYLGNGWSDCTEIWLVVMGPTAMRFIRATTYEWNTLHVRTCAPLS